jgi:hypothetical protein
MFALDGLVADLFGAIRALLRHCSALGHGFGRSDDLTNTSLFVSFQRGFGILEIRGCNSVGGWYSTGHGLGRDASSMSGPVEEREWSLPRQSIQPPLAGRWNGRGSLGRGTRLAAGNARFWAPLLMPAFLQCAQAMESLWKPWYFQTAKILLSAQTSTYNSSFQHLVLSLSGGEQAYRRWETNSQGLRLVANLIRSLVAGTTGGPALSLQ